MILSLMALLTGLASAQTPTPVPAPNYSQQVAANMIVRMTELQRSGTPVPITASSVSAASSTVTAFTVGVTEVAGPAASATRIGVIVYNNGTVQVFYRSTTGVTTANGLPIDPGSYAVLDATFGSKLAFFFISGTAAQNVRVEEFFQ